jgi:hypothetical protein
MQYLTRYTHTGRPDAALNCFEHLLKLDRAYPNILGTQFTRFTGTKVQVLTPAVRRRAAWLVRARANMERATSTSNAQNLPDYLQIR